MKKPVPKLALAAAMALTIFTIPALASEGRERLEDANRTVNHLKSDPAFAAGPWAQKLRANLASVH